MVAAPFLDARFLAQQLDKDIFIAPNGMNVFPVYSMASGGLLAITIFYLKDRDVDWPATAIDLGRESTLAEFRHKGIYAIEVPWGMSYEEALEHARDVVSSR